MKFLLAICILVISFSCKAQSFFAPKQRPFQENLKFGASAVSMPLTKNFIRPSFGVTAATSNSEQLAAGFGVEFQHDRADSASNSYVPIYSIAAIGFIGTTGSKLTRIGGLVVGIPGTGGIIRAGYGYDFTNKVPLLLTGVYIPL